MGCAMLDTTKTAIKAMCAADPSITPAMLNHALQILDGKTATALTNPEPMDRILTRRQVAEIMHKDVRTVSVYARKGKIKKICCGENGERASGYSEQSVRELMSGKAA